MERRWLAEIRADIQGNRLVGHAALFDVETRIKDFYETIGRRSFERVLKEQRDLAREGRDAVMQVDHEGLPLGRTGSGTLRLGTDSTGLAFENDLPNTSLARDVRELVERGDLRSMSFGFQVAEDLWSVRSDGTQLRSVQEFGRLFDVSVVTFPAYAGTDVALRSELPTPPITPRASARGQAARIRARVRKAIP